MTPWVIYGYVLLILSVAWFISYLPMSYDSEGGAIGMLPVFGGAFYPPPYGVIGFALITHGRYHGWYLLIWILATLAAYQAISYAGDLGARKKRRNQGK